MGSAQVNVLLMNIYLILQAVMEALRKSSRHMTWEKVTLSDEEEQDLANPLLTRAAAMLRHP